MGSRVTRRVVFVDLDNTLYDWVRFFAPALRGMCRVLSSMANLPLGEIYEELKGIFRTHGTVEYSFAVQELPSLQALHPGLSGPDIANIYRPAIDVFQHRRRMYLHPYPGVEEGLFALRRAGSEVYGVTDSRRWQALNRLRQLRLEGYFDGLFCVEDHAQPSIRDIDLIRTRPSEHYMSAIKRVVTLPWGLRKPDPALLHYAIAMVGGHGAHFIYIGDSLVKDIQMAQRAGVYDVWARYGTRVSALDFGTIVRVTDWSQRAVREALHQTPLRLRVAPSSVADSFDAAANLALMNAADLPKRAAWAGIAPPVQLAIPEVGPTMVAG